MRYWLVIPAAGAGRRFGGRVPKQYADIKGRTVIEWALRPFVHDPRCAGVAVALGPADTHWPKLAARLPPVITVIGGAERSESVRNALAALGRHAGPNDWVLVHDAARPCLADADRDRLIEQLQSHPVGGVLAARVLDTLKRGDAEGAIAETVERAGLWRALTPQMFRYAKLCEALDAAMAAHRFPSDESQALEWTGVHPAVVPGAASNIKITSPDDLPLAAAILESAGR